MKDNEEEPSPFRMNQENTIHCRGCMCWSLTESGEKTDQCRSPSSRHAFGHQSFEEREKCARDLFGQSRKEKVSTLQKKSGSELKGKVDSTPTVFFGGAKEFLDCSDGLARWEGGGDVKEVSCDSGSTSGDDISVQIYSQDEDEDKHEGSSLAKEGMEDAFLCFGCGNLESKKVKAGQSPKQKGINPLKDIGLLAPLGKLPARKPFLDYGLYNRNQCRIHQDDLTYNHDQLMEPDVNSGPSQCVGKTNENISQSQLIKDTCQKAFCASKMSVCLTFPKDNTAQKNNQYKDLEEILKPVSDHKEQIVKHQCKDSSFVCSFKAMNKNRLDPNKAYEVRKTPAQIWEESKVHCENYFSKDRNHSLIDDPFQVKLDIQATVETSCVLQSSASCESSTSDSTKSLSKERSSEDRDKYDIVAKPCTNEPRHKHRRLSTDSDLSEGTDGQMKNTMITSPHKCQKLGYDPHMLQSKHFWPGFVDTHCHLDFLFRHGNHNSTSHARFQAQCRGHDAYPVSFEGCIAVFCQPWTFRETSWWEGFLKEANVWAAFGCHPHYAHSFGKEEEEHLRLALLNPKVLALGEIGLDYSSRNKKVPEQQKSVFRRQLKIALEFSKPLVIHCRDAEKDCLAILKELVPHNYKIHRHCFTEGWEEAQEWLSAFSNLYLGITGLVTFPNSERAKRLQEVLRQIPLSRLLLETDAPYFRPYCYQGSGRWSHPGMAIHVAAQVASVRGESIQRVLAHARSNTKMVYGV